MNVARLALFASGSGTNVENIIKYFGTNEALSVSLVLSNKKDAFVIERAKKFGVESVVFNRNDLSNSLIIDNILARKNIDIIILAGFLLKMPERILRKFPSRVINIHPALLPKYGGLGMYGMNVHKAVIEGGERESGITIHLVDEEYDRGKTLFQALCTIDKNDTPDTLAEKIHRLEQLYFPLVIEGYIRSL
ncbi:MAG: phosphoribosylglycinamide formyltransferase [Bacteroidales bacterium]|nr:phosphoribosylglycinamide formyltransferase [Bacteroidales bacterium]MDD3989329.1 phosphoribosylglycinamide formyltransferase [Bacteroidales bacterium]MDD4638693.1 phosphoribosylglycinamide formyltransferase [Bacteroidales bacterium]